MAERRIPLQVVRSLGKLFGLRVDKEGRAVAQLDGTPIDQGVEANRLQSLFSWIQDQYSKIYEGKNLYAIYEDMDKYDLVSSALDVYSEDATQFDPEHNASIWVETGDEKLAKDAKKLFDHLQIQDGITEHARSITKNGEMYLKPTIVPGKGIVGIQELDPARVLPKRDQDNNVIGYDLEGYVVQDKDYHEISPMYQPWEIIHFTAKPSVLYPARRPYKQLILAEDSLLLYRLMKAPDRLVYYIDVGDNAPERQRKIVQDWMMWTKKTQQQNPATGQFDTSLDPRSVMDDIFWATKKDSNSKIDKLAGAANIGDITDIEYWRNKFFSAIRIPKSFMGFEGDVNSKATLLIQDVRYTRTVKKINRAIRTGYHRLLQIHLIALGSYEVKDLKFKIGMTPISYLEDQMKSETLNLKAGMAQTVLATIQAMGLSMKSEELKKYILKTIIQLPDDVVNDLEAEAGDAGGLGQSSSPDYDPSTSGSLLPEPGQPDALKPPGFDYPGLKADLPDSVGVKTRLTDLMSADIPISEKIEHLDKLLDEDQDKYPLPELEASDEKLIKSSTGTKKIMVKPIIREDEDDRKTRIRGSRRS